MAGDWNVPLNYKADKYNYKHNNNIKSNKAIIENMKTLDLHDVWCIQNQDTNKFTWRGPQNKMARLDYFIVSSDLQLYLKQLWYRALS